MINLINCKKRIMEGTESKDMKIHFAPMEGITGHVFVGLIPDIFLEFGVLFPFSYTKSDKKADQPGDGGCSS